MLQPIGSFKIRGAYNVVRQLSPDVLREGVWTVSAGNAAQGVALAARKVGARCSVMVMDTAPDTKLARDRAARRVDRPRQLRRMLAHGRSSTARRSHDRALRASVRRRSLHRRQRHGRRSKFSRICPTWTRSSRRSAAAGCSPGIAAARARAPAADTKIFAAEPETAAPLSASLAARTAAVLRRLEGIVRRRRRRQVGARDDVAAARDARPAPSSSRWTKRRAAMKLAAERAHVIAEGAAGCAIAAALERTRRRRQSRRGRVGRQHRSRQVRGAGRLHASRQPAGSSMNRYSAFAPAPRTHRTGSTSSPSISGGAGIPDGARRVPPASTTRCGGRPRTTRCACCG